MKKRFNVLVTRRLHRSALDELKKKCNVSLHTGKIPNYIENPSALQNISKNNAPITKINQILDQYKV